MQIDISDEQIIKSLNYINTKLNFINENKEDLEVVYGQLNSICDAMIDCAFYMRHLNLFEAYYISLTTIHYLRNTLFDMLNEMLINMDDDLISHCLDEIGKMIEFLERTLREDGVEC